MMEELGVKHACYGEYRCSTCSRTWASVNAWRDYGQKCTECTTNHIKIQANNLAELHFYICESCKKTWKNKEIKKGMPCKECKRVVLPMSRIEFNKLIKKNKLIEYNKSRIDEKSLFDDPNYTSNGAHPQDLCEKCKDLGWPCWCGRCKALGRPCWWCEACDALGRPCSEQCSSLASRYGHDLLAPTYSALPINHSAEGGTGNERAPNPGPKPTTVHKCTIL